MVAILSMSKRNGKIRAMAIDFNIVNAEKLLISAAMISCQSRREAAKALGIGERSLYRKLSEYGLTFAPKKQKRRFVTIDLNTGEVSAEQGWNDKSEIIHLRGERLRRRVRS